MSTAAEQRSLILTREAQAEEGPKPEIFANLEARKVLQFLLRSPRTPITAEILPTDEIHYPQLKGVVEGTPASMVDLLSRMVDARVLVEDMTDKAPACPECGSKQVSTRFTCPKCYSYDISRSYLYEHLKCGKVANDDTFRKGDKLVCPKCQAILHNFGVEYRAVGAWYQCHACNESFNAPTQSHFCRPKRHQFSMDRVRLEPIYQYRLNPTVLADIRREVLMYNDAVTMLEALGLTVLSPCELPGKTGQQHPFDIVTTLKGGRFSAGKTITIDVFTSSESIPLEPVRDFAAKTRDMSKGTESYLLAIPGLSEDAKTLVRNLKLNTIEASTVKDAMTTLLSRDTFKGLAA